ncbi:MAG TPA: EAL domain-containing protein, partial [Actinotalea sp.]|nr:EAL domain-containing protein [Actinotalea sp.]
RSWGDSTVDALEHDRLESLATYGVLGGGGPDLRDIAALAATACATPVAVIGFLVEDRLELRSATGTPVCSVPREVSLSARVVESGLDLVIEDLPGLAPAPPMAGRHPAARAFAAVPLVGRDGLPLGVLAVHDTRPRPFHAEHLASLRALARLAMSRLELHRLDRWEGRPGDDSGVDPVRLRQALDAGELVPYFEPIVDLATGRRAALEALVRWVRPQHGVVRPAAFLPAVESSGLMIPVGRRVRRLAMDVLAEIAGERSGAAGQGGLRMSVNISPVELARQAFAAELLADAHDRGIEPSSLVVEVTETAAIAEPVQAVALLRELRDAGVAVALDDYGAGSSSLLRMLRLPLTMIKIDRELTAAFTCDSRVGTALASTIALAHDLGLTVVAEGVETALQEDAVRAMGCELAQGWHWGRARSGEALLAEARASEGVPASGAVRAGGAVDLRTRPRQVPRPHPAGDHCPATEGTYVVDLERRIRSWDAEATAITGYGVQDVVGQRC